MVRKSISFVLLSFVIMSTALAANEIQAAKPAGSSESPVPKVIIACDSNYPPFTQLGADGQAYGMLIDLWRLWAEKTNHRVEFLMTDWPNTLTAIEEGKADLHSGLFPTAERSIWMHFSKQIYEVESAIFYLPKHGKITSSEALAGQKWAQFDPATRLIISANAIRKWK